MPLLLHTHLVTFHDQSRGKKKTRPHIGWCKYKQIDVKTENYYYSQILHYFLDFFSFGSLAALVTSSGFSALSLSRLARIPTSRSSARA